MTEVRRFSGSYEEKSTALSTGLDQIKAVLTPRMLDFLQQLKHVLLIEIKDYQSAVYRRASLGIDVDQYGRSDGFLAELVNDDGSRYLVMAQKVRQNPYQLFSAYVNGIDLRPLIVTAIKVGDEQIEFLGPGSEIEVFTGKNGHLEVLIPYLVQILGYEIGLERFTNLV